MVTALSFLFGLALGSFLHVLVSRYDPERFLLTPATLGGRSYCPHCKRTLAWYELVPLLSFLVQRGRCRACGAKISWSYFGVELACGLLVALVPMGLPLVPAILWTAVFLILLLITLIDMRLQIIPDELSAALAILGIGLVLAGGAPFDWPGHFGAGLGAALFFAALIAITRGKGMGWGDVKLAFVLGLVFGWPDTLLLVMLAFVIGAAVGVALIIARSKNLKSALPFGPFLALAALIVFFFGQSIIGGYLRLLVA